MNAHSKTFMRQRPADSEPPDVPAPRRWQLSGGGEDAPVEMGGEYDAVIAEELEFFGVIVAFLGNRRGLLHIEHMPLGHGARTDLLTVGQPLRIRVFGLNPMGIYETTMLDVAQPGPSDKSTNSTE